MGKMSLIYVMVGGGLGAMLRYIVMSFIGRLNFGTFPYATLAVNIFGSFLMGLWIAVMANMLPERGRDLNLLFAVGVLGGFTTFSTFSLDIFYLVERGDNIQAVIYVLASVLLSFLALIGGMWLIKMITW
jgi:CrcB protein